MMDYTALNYPCPYCKAKRGEYCRSLRTGTIYRTSAHVERENLIHKHKVQPELNTVQQPVVQPKTVPVQVKPNVFTTMAVKPIVARYAIRQSDQAILVQHPINNTTVWIPKSTILETEIHEHSTIFYVNLAFNPNWE